MKAFRMANPSRLLLLLLLASCLASPWALAYDNGINDLHGGTPAPPGSSGNPPGGGPGPDGGPSSSEPVAIYSGQYFLNATDFEIPGRMPLRVRRFYRSGSSYQGMFGRGWNMEFNERILVLATNGNLVLRRNDTARDEFVDLGNNSYASSSGSYETLFRNDDGTYTLADKYGSIRRYNADGTLSEVRDRNGNQLMLTYQPGGKQPINAISEFSHFTNAILVARDYRLARIEAAFNNTLSGRFIEFFYDGSGRVTNVTDFTGRSWRYDYDAAGYGELRNVTTPPADGFPAGLTTRYTYTTNQHSIETVMDRSGNTLLTNRYDTAGRVIRQNWGSAVWSFAYPSATDRWETNGNGYRIQRIFDANGQMTERRDFTAGLRPTDPSSYSTRYGYGTNGLQSKIIYPAGNVETARVDARGNLVEARRKAADTNDTPQDIVSAMTYEPRFNLIKTITGPRGDVTAYVYDYEDPASGTTNGNLLRIIYPAVDGTNSTVSYSYTVHGQMDTITNDVGMVTRFVYDPATGYVLQRIDGFGSSLAATNSFSHDARGNVLTSSDPRGNTTTNLYDNLDRLIQVTAPAPFGYVTRYSYTGNGQLAQIRRQTGDPSHPEQTNTYSYDLLGHLQSVTDDLGGITAYSYDANGNQTRLIDANTNLTTLVYDERNLLWKAIDAQSNSVVMSYTLNGLLARRTDPRTNSAVLAYDRYDRLIATTNADSTIELFAYDDASNLTGKRSRAGRWITNSYDLLGRLTLKRYTDGAAIQYGYDRLGRLVRATDTNGVWSYNYNVLGRLVTATNAAGKVLQYGYDRAGNQTLLVYPDNTFLTYAYDSLNRLTNINYAGIRNIAAFAYDPLSRRTQVDFGNGTRSTYTYDYANRLAQLTHNPVGGGAPLARFVYAFDPAGNRLSQDTTGTRFPGRTSFEYDRIYQLTRVQYPAGNPFPTTSFAYDAAGNRTQVTAGVPVNYVADNMNRYSSVSGQPYTYTPDGAFTGDGSWGYAYDDEERLTLAQGPGVTARYAYDPFNRRISKNVNGTGRQFVYNEIGDVPMLLGETDGAGALQAKYVFYGLGSLAMIVSNTVFTLHCDHLERPVLATDEGGAVAWEAAFSAFGDPSLAAQNRVQQPLRTPGQYEDSESGLNYNLARYYDPKTGRFLSEDPALESGSPLFSQIQENNAYAYLRNNPANAVDPDGQSVLFIVCSAGLPVCSAAIFCSLNIGACSGGLVCSANVGYCSLGVACSGQAGPYGACSAGVACSGQAGRAVACSAGVVCSGQTATAGACSVGVRCSGQAQWASVCSASVGGCSAQVTPGLDACSASVVGVCSVQAGAYGAGACSLQVAGFCSAQAAAVGASVCSAQRGGVCSAQAGGLGYSGCSAQTGGACSAQAGFGRADCSAQGGGLCSVQVGGWAGGCSSQGSGACSVAGFINGTCSASGGSCSATFGWGASCDKNAGIQRRPGGPNPHNFLEADEGAQIASFCAEDVEGDRCRIRLATYRCARIVLYRDDDDKRTHREVLNATPLDGNLLTVELPAPGGNLNAYKLKLITARGREQTVCPIVARRPSSIIQVVSGERNHEPSRSAFLAAASGSLPSGSTRQVAGWPEEPPLRKSIVSPAGFETRQGAMSEVQRERERTRHSRSAGGT